MRKHLYLWFVLLIAVAIAGAWAQTKDKAADHAKTQPQKMKVHEPPTVLIYPGECLSMSPVVHGDPHGTIVFKADADTTLTWDTDNVMDSDTGTPGQVKLAAGVPKTVNVIANPNAHKKARTGYQIGSCTTRNSRGEKSRGSDPNEIIVP